MKRNDGAIVIEKRIGCYWAGVAFSLLLILLLLVVLCIPHIFSFYGASEELNTYLLFVLIGILFVVGCAIVFFINYQHRQAFKERLKSEHGIYTLQRQRLRRKGESSVSGTELQKLKLDLNSNEKNATIKIEKKYCT